LRFAEGGHLVVEFVAYAPGEVREDEGLGRERRRAHLLEVLLGLLERQVRARVRVKG